MRTEIDKQAAAVDIDKVCVVASRHCHYQCVHKSPAPSQALHRGHMDIGHVCTTPTAPHLTHPSLPPSLCSLFSPAHTSPPRLLQDPIKSRKPDPGATAGVGRAGRIGSTGGTLLTQHLLKKRGQLVHVDREMDPRESILRHADKEDDISMLTAAYNKTQPTPIFAEPEPESSGEEEG